MKKILLHFTALLLSVCCLLAAAAPAFAVIYTDVGDLSTEYRDAINYLGDNGLMVGTSSTQFSPDQELNRAMAVTLLYRLSGDTTKYSSSFPDVASGSYYYYAVGWGVAKGIVYGHTDGKFHPYDTLSLQDFCTFLYRYAKKYDPYSTQSPHTVDLSSASDYSNISSYAVEAMSWFFSWGLKDRKNDREALSPKSAVERKDAALFLHRYRFHVEGIVSRRDNFSFLNNGNYFVSGDKKKYCISTADYRRLSNYAATYDQETVDYLNDNAAMSWQGSCYGMSLSVILDYLGKIDLDGNFCNGVDSIYQIPSLKRTSSGLHKTTKDRTTGATITQVESKINLYHLSQFVFYKSADEWSYPSYTNVGLQDVLSGLQCGGIGLFVFSYTPSLPLPAHAVVAYGKPASVKDCTTTYYPCYHVKVYDPNTSETGLLHIYSRSGNDMYDGIIACNSDKYEITFCKFENDFTRLKALDIDYDDNVLPAAVLDEEASESVLDTYNILFVQAAGGFTVTNGRGESFHFRAGSITGAMPVYGFDFAVFGENTPCELRFLVDPDESYTCTADEGGSLLSFHYMSQDNYVGGQTDGVASYTSAVISEDIPSGIQWTGGDIS